MTPSVISPCFEPPSTRVDKHAALELLEAQRAALGVSSDGCMMCAVCTAHNDDVVFETPIAQVRLDRFACTSGHLLIVPKKHVEHTTDLSWEEYQHLQELAYLACNVLSRELAPKRVFVASLGSSKALAQSFPHFHIHVVPVFADDERARPAHVLSWSSGVTIYSEQQAARLTRRLARGWKNNCRGSNMAIKSRKSTTGLRRWVAAALSLMATNACSAGSAGSTAPTPTVAPTAATVAPTAFTSDEATDIIEPEIILAEDQVPVHPTLHNAMHENPAKPVVTGTLLVTADGALAFAADVDRHAIFQVNLTDRSVSRFDLEPDDEPGQMVEVLDAAQLRYVFAVLRGRGALLKLDPLTGTSEQIPVCEAPRGLTFDAVSNRVFAACETGELVTVDPALNAVERTVVVAPDLRDVQVLGESLIVSRFRSAEVIVLDRSFAIQARSVPNWSPDCAQSAVMHRLVVRDSNVYISHQMGTTGTLDTQHGGYAGDAACSAGPMQPVIVVSQDVSQLQSGTEEFTTLPSTGLSEFEPSRLASEGTLAGLGPHWAFGLDRRAGPVDLAVSHSGRIAASVTGDSLWPRARSVVSLTLTTQPSGSTSWSVETYPTTGMLTAVAFDANDQWIAQSREPAQLLFEDGTVVALDPSSAANTGLDLFYVNTGVGLSCAGCHPEGDEDGRTWAFPQGLRRTQTLGGGILSRAPFHWDGEMPEMNTLVQEVMLERMAFSTPVTEAQVELLGRWMDRIPPSPARLNPVGISVDPAVERGRVVFNDPTVACATCHNGVALTDNKAYDVGTGGTYFTPTLLGIGLRNRFMHDGCASTLHERFGLCGGGDAHGKTSHLAATQLDDLVTFMETL